MVESISGIMPPIWKVKSLYIHYLTFHGNSKLNGNNTTWLSHCSWVWWSLLALLKGLSHIHGSHNGSSRILIRGVPARNTTVTVFLLRCTFFKFFKGAFTHSRIITRTIPGHCSIQDHPWCLRHHLCWLRHHRVGHRAGIRRDPWRTGISVIKKLNLRKFPSRSTQMKKLSVPLLEGTVFLPCSHQEPRIKTGIHRMRNSGCTRWLYGRKHGAFQEWYRSFYIRVLLHGRKIYFSPDMPVRQGPRRMPARWIHGNAEDNMDDSGLRSGMVHMVRSVNVWKPLYCLFILTKYLKII